MGWPRPKTLMGFQQVSEAEKHQGTTNLSGPKPQTQHLSPRGSQSISPSIHTHAPIEYKIYCHPTHRAPGFGRKKVSTLYFAQAGLAQASPQSNLSFPWSRSSAHPKPVVGRSRRRTSVFWVGCFIPLPLLSLVQSSLTIFFPRCHVAAPCSQNTLP